MKRWVLSILILLLLSVYVYKVRREVVSLIAVLAYVTVFSLLLSPICRKLEAKGMHPAWAAGMTVIGLFLIVLATLAALIPHLASRSFYLLKRIAPVASEMMDRWQIWSQSNVFIQSTLSDTGGIVGTSLGTITGKLAQMGMTVAAQLGRIGFSLVLTYYVLCDRQRIVNHLLLLVPLAWRNPMLMGVRACSNAMMSYLSGLLKTSMFVGGATYVGLILLGVQDALLLAVFMGVLEVLPYLGPILAAIPILLSAVMQGADTAAFVLIMLILVQQIEGNIISPYFTASSTSVHPLAAISSVFILGTLMGFWGILLAVPALVLAQSIGWSWMQARQAARESANAQKVLCTN